MKRLITEPLLHFLLLGAAIFLVYELVSSGGPDAEPPSIVVTRDKVEALAERFTRTWHRAPSPVELEGLIDDFVREEAAVQEATSLGFEREDSVIRRLMRQRLEFVTQDLAALGEPVDAELREHLRAHPEDFRTETGISFSQVFLDPRRRGEALPAQAARLRDRLNGAGGEVDPARLGDVTLLEHQLTALPPSEIARRFGEPFADELPRQPPGRWAGPISSAYGEHLVYVHEVLPGSVPPLSAVREPVRRAWLEARRAEALDGFYQVLLERYEVIVEMPPAEAGDAADRLAERR
jgi:hypothetical protein